MSKSVLHLVVDDGPKKGETLDRKPGALIRIGRVVRGNTISIKDPSISQKHLTVEIDTQICRWAVTDLDTPNGTFVNGVRIPSSAAFPLSDGDSVKIGENTAISIKIVDVEDGERSKRVVGKRGRKGASVRVSAEEDGIELPKRGRTGSDRVSEKESVLDLEGESGRETRRSSARVLKKDEILHPVCVEDGTDSPVKLRRGRKGDSSRVLKARDALGDNSDVPESMEERSLKEEYQVLDSVVGDENEVQKLGRGVNFGRVLKEDETLDPVLMEDRTRAPKNLPRGRRGVSSRASKTDESPDVVVEDSIEVPVSSLKGRKNYSRVSKMNEIKVVTDIIEVVPKRRKNYSRVSKINEIKGAGVADIIDVQESMLKGRRGNSKMDETKDDAVVADSSEVPKSLRRGRRRRDIPGKLSKKGEDLCPVVEDSTEVPTSFGRGRKSSQILKKDEALDSIVEENQEAPPKLRRGRSSSNAGLKKEGNLNLVPEGSNQAPKNVGGKRKNVSSNVLKDAEALDSVVKENIKAPEDLERGIRINLPQVSGSVAEDRAEEPVKLGRGKRRANSTRISNNDEVLASAVEESIRVPDVGRGRVRKAPARRTRAVSARLSKKEQESAPLNSPLNSVENIYHQKVLRGDQLGTSKKIQSPKEKKDNRSQIRETFDKENKGSTQISNEDVAEPSGMMLFKTWNGNGIPNTTSKYKEDAKVSWHATPFEERLEKALSGDKLLPQRS